MAFSHFSLLWSKETPKISKPLSLYLLYIFTTFGFSRRQGPHQEAQKSISTYLPFKEESDFEPPSGVGKVKSGAMPPILTEPNFDKRASSDFVYLEFGWVFLKTVSMLSAKGYCSSGFIKVSVL